MTHEKIKERLWAEVMEDYVITAELGHLAKDQVAHKAEMRAHLDKLVDWITTYRAQVLEEDRSRITEIIKDELKNAPLEVQMTKGMVFANVLKRIPHQLGDMEKIDLEYNKPTFYGTIVNSSEWQSWVKENEQNPKWDVHESMETGWLSPGHFQAFLEFVRRHA